MSYNLIAFQVGTLDRRDIGRSRHEVQNSIQQLLNTFVTVSASAANRNSGTLTGTFTKSGFHFVDAGLLTLKISHHEVVIQLTDLLYHLGMIQLCIVFHVIRNLFNGDILTLVIVVDVSFHLKQVDDALEIILFTDGQLDADCIFAQSGFDLLNSIVEICTHSAIQYSQRTLNLYGEVNVARSVDDVDTMLQSARCRFALELMGPVTGRSG